MMDFNERVIPGISANFLYQEALARYEFASKLIKKGSFILDVGCGTGYGCSLLSHKAEVLGVDNDREAIDYAKKHYGKNAKYVLGNAEKLKFKSQFDIICAFEIVEHLSNPSTLLKLIKTLLKKRGVFILSTPNKNYVSPEGGVASPYHIREYNYDEFRSLLKKYFTKVEILGQTKSKKAQEALKDFMRSQTVRQSLVDKDMFDIRK